LVLSNVPSWLAFGTIFRITDSFSEQLLESQAAIGKPETSFLGRVTGRISKIVSDFIEVKRNFILDFLHKKTAKNLKTISAHSKALLIFSSSGTIPLKYAVCTGLHDEGYGLLLHKKTAKSFENHQR
jgi:hypothetical protein